MTFKEFQKFKQEHAGDSARKDAEQLKLIAEARQEGIKLKAAVQAAQAKLKATED